MGILSGLGLSFGSDGILGIQSFSNPGNAKVSDGNYAAAVLLLGVQSQYLQVQNFQFAVPLDATVTGLRVEVERSSTVNLGCKDASVRLYKGGTLTGDDKADTATLWSITDTSVFYGGPGDLWGWTSMTPADLNSSTFGVGVSALAVVAATAQVDFVGVTAYYTGSSTSYGSQGMGIVRAGNGMSTNGGGAN